MKFYIFICHEKSGIKILEIKKKNQKLTLIIVKGIIILNSYGQTFMSLRAILVLGFSCKWVGGPMVRNTSCVVTLYIKYITRNLIITILVKILQFYPSWVSEWEREREKKILFLFKGMYRLYSIVHLHKSSPIFLELKMLGDPWKS